MTEAVDTTEIINKYEELIDGLSHLELAILNKMVSNRLRLVNKAGALLSISNFKVGDSVSWNGNDGSIRKGIIIRLNKTTVSVKVNEKGHWVVPPELLRKNS